MSILHVNKLWTGRGGTDTHLNRRTYREMWEIICSTPDEDPNAVANAVGLPQLGSAALSDPTAYFVDFDLAQSEDTPFHWYFSARYDSQPELPEAFDPGASGASPGDIPENPLLRPTVWSVNFQKTSEPAVKWYKVDPLENVEANLSLVRNSADLPFDPPATIEVSRPVIRAVKNIPPAQATLAFFSSLQDVVNDRLWRGLQPRVARIDGVTGQGRFENGVPFVEVSLEIALKWDTWDLRILDAGYMEKLRRGSGPGGPVVTWTKMRDPFNQEASSPIPLDGAGKKLAPDGTPVFLRGIPQNYRRANFAVLLGI